METDQLKYILEAALLASPRFEAVFHTDNASVFRLADTKEGS